MFDAGTGTGKTSFIIKQLLPWALERSKKERRFIKILLLCNRVSLKSQDIRKIIESGVGIDLTQYDSPDKLDEIELNASNSRFIRVWTYQKIEYWQQRKPEWVKKWLDSYTYIVCDEAQLTGCPFLFSRAKNVQILFQKLHFSADSAFYIYRIIVYFTVIPTSVGALGAGGREFESRHSDQDKSHDTAPEMAIASWLYLL